MITILTSHNHIWNPEQIATDVIAEFSKHNCAEISLNGEGPCADSIGLYNMLDYICKQFQFDKKKIKIVTCNAEEQHPDYQIEIRPAHWIYRFVQAAEQTQFVSHKDPAKNLFGCLYNIPSWERLCLLSYINQHSNNQNLLHCNGTWESHNYNSYYLNSITDFCPSEFSNIAKYLETAPTSLTKLEHKPVTGADMAALLPYYNDFFVDVVCETYANGLTFFPTEKTLRPMYASTPFILYGPQGFLDNLHSRYGFQTFGEFWDESYDNLQNYQRVQAMYKIIDQLDAMTEVQRVSLWHSMQPVLAHNRQQLMALVKTRVANDTGRSIRPQDQH